MKQVVKIKGSEPRVSTFLIYEQLGYKTHKQLKEVIRPNIEHFDDLGLRRLETTKPPKGSDGGRPIEAYLLNEDHFVLLIMLCKNSPEAVSLKVRLSKEFRRMKMALVKIAANRNNEEWNRVRCEGKIPRRIETDKIKLFIDYAIEQGSKSAEKYYMIISKMENKALFIVEQTYPNLRDVLGVAELDTIKQADHIVAKALQDGMRDGLHYKAIYKMASNRVKMFSEIRGQSAISMMNEMNQSKLN